ncbi:MAG: hypothetical protein LC112_13810 [Flavobacteriales bacterium]|nr:hypothetical protein [Flavobacteriales bacterium]
MVPIYVANAVDFCVCPAIPTRMRCNLYRHDLSSSNLGGNAGYEPTKYEPGSYLLAAIGTFTTISHQVVGLYTRNVGGNDWGSNLIDQVYAISNTLNGNVPVFKDFLENVPAIVEAGLVFDISSSGSIVSITYPINQEFLLIIREFFDNGVEFYYLFGAIQQGGSGSPHLGDFISGNYEIEEFSEGNIAFGTSCELVV